MESNPSTNDINEPLPKPMGGSELAYYTLESKLDKGWDKDVNMVLSHCNFAYLDPKKINIIWQQLNWNEESVTLLADENFTNCIDYYVWVSHWQYNEFRTRFHIPAYKSVIIKNATHPVKFVERNKTEKLKLIYTSTPWRGLDVVLEAFRLLNRQDIELDIYSSTKIYGLNFQNITKGQFDELFDTARNMPGVNFKGYATNEEVRAAVKNAHIFAYPNTFEETSCMSAIEALAAGCNVVTTNLGALPETCGDWPIYVTYGPNRPVLASRYAMVLNEAINNYWSDHVQTHIRKQSLHYNEFWTWDQRIWEWRNFLNSVEKNK
jgi:glycosyltransferase involved in cell wall biosynthesis